MTDTDPIIIMSRDWRQSDVTTLARVTDDAQHVLIIAEVSAVILRIKDTGAFDPLAIIAELPLTGMGTMYDTLQLDALWQNPPAPDAIGYNFKHVLVRPWEEYDREWIAGHIIRLEYEFQRPGKSSLWVVHDRELIPQVAV